LLPAAKRAVARHHHHHRRRRQVLASFQEQLLALNSEKDQRNLIKSLLAEAGTDE
jgi:hypothetical protein